MSSVKRFAGLWVLFSILAPGEALAATAGVFQFVAGDVRVALVAGSERPAAKGVLVSVGDTITTARASMAQIKMGDGAVIVVQPESRLTVAEFRYTGTEDGTEKVKFRLEQGGFRSVTGAIGHTHKGNYLIETPIAHIGVRGTDHESWYFPAPVSLEGVATAAGLYNKVNVGLTYIQTAQGEVAVLPNQVGYAASAADSPRLLDAMPGFFIRSYEPMLAGGSSQKDSAPQVADQGNARGVGWGSWQGGLATAGNRAGNSAMPASVASRLPPHAAAFPQQVITATYDYVPGSGTVSGTASPNGANSMINSLSVGVNLTAQTISSYSLSATVGSQNWTADGRRGTFNQFMSSGIMLQGNCSGCIANNPNASPGAVGSATGGFSGGLMNTSFNMSSAMQQSMQGSASLAQ